MKSEEHFYENRVKQSDGSIYTSRRTECRNCTDGTLKSYRDKNPDVKIYNNSKRYNKMYGIPFDLDRKIIREIISNSCHYCGETEHIGLDRVENSIAYTRDNIVSCCIRCNSMKRDMPLKAWLALVPTVKRTFEDGLFNGWLAHNKENSKKKSLRTEQRPDHEDKRIGRFKHPKESS